MAAKMSRAFPFSPLEMVARDVAGDTSRQEVGASGSLSASTAGDTREEASGGGSSSSSSGSGGSGSWVGWVRSRESNRGSRLLLGVLTCEAACHGG
jgi:hypothetical protein